KGSGAFGIAPRVWFRTKVAMLPKVRVSGLSSAIAASLNSVPGDTRKRLEANCSNASTSSGLLNAVGARPVAIADAIIGHRMKKTSQSPRAHRADVAVERKITEKSKAIASHPPP